MHLQSLGWSPADHAAFGPLALDGHVPARVVREERGRYHVSQGGEAVLVAEVSGALRHRARGPGEFPAVGDWVAVEPLPAGQARIHALIPRRTSFVRSAAGGPVYEQVVAANLDGVLLLAGLDGELNLRRLERYLTVAWERGVEPSVVLTKADLCPDLGDVLCEVCETLPGVQVLAVDSLSGEVDAVATLLKPKRTYALLGSSGVGKSTLLNALMGEGAQRTGAVRASDGRGKHTTTHRELFALPCGALVIDTPGMRELALWDGEEGLQRTFSDVEELSAGCRFRDCKHDGEPGCAVEGAIRAGDLDADRLSNYRKLQRELRFVKSKQDARTRHEDKQRRKRLTKSYRSRTNKRT